MIKDIRSIMSDCARWFLVLGILILAGGAGSGAVLNAASAAQSGADSNSAGKTGGVADLLERPAFQVNNPQQRKLFGIAKSGDRVVAVGERGIIVFSDDKGKTWHQAKVPTSVTLTAVTFPAKSLGWAIGHAGTVLHTTDGGETWTRQLDGASAARIAYDDAQAYAAGAGVDSALADRGISDAKQLIDDGPDKPFLDMHFSNEQEGIIVGAYGLIFHTGDGGNTWKSWMTRMDNPDGFHFYTIQQAGDSIYLAGEQGLCFRSLDAGRTFQKIDTGYRGSYFTSTIMGQDEFVIAGLRGNAYRSIEGRADFTKMEVPVPVSILSSLTTEAGSVLLINQAGQILENSLARPNTFQVVGVPRLRTMVASVIQMQEGVLLGVGNNGVVRILLPGGNSDITKGEL